MSDASAPDSLISHCSQKNASTPGGVATWSARKNCGRYPIPKLNTVNWSSRYLPAGPYRPASVTAASVGLLNVVTPPSTNRSSGRKYVEADMVASIAARNSTSW